MRAWYMFLALAAALSVALPARAHGMRTAYVELREIEGGRVSVVVRSGASYGAVSVVMPEGCARDGSGLYACDRPLRGAAIRVDGLGGVVSDAVVVAVLADGDAPSGLVRAGAPSWTVPSRDGSLASLARYARAGLAHVLSGPDHLLFLAILVVALRRARAVLVAETAFTASHSIAFSAAALGWIHVPAAVAEALIALSLVLAALDAGRRRLDAGAGARMAFVFGAVHGLGFAGGLEELGVPKGAVVPALAGFAAGVEIGQVLFLAACFAALAAARRVSLLRPLELATTYAVGSAGFFWLLDRALPLVRGALP